MSLKFRFALLLSLLMGVLIAAAVVLRQVERGEFDTALQSERQLRAQLLNHWVDATSRALPQFASDVAQAEEFRRFLGNPADATARGKLAAGLAAAEIDALWVLGAGGKVTFSISAAPGAVAPAFPLESGAFTTLVTQTPNPRFFAETGGKLFELTIRRLQPSSGPHEWAAVAREWDDAQLRALQDLTDARVSLGRPDQVVQASPSDTRIEITRSLADWQGHAVRVLRVQYEIPEIYRASRGRWQQVLIFLAFGVLLIVALGLAIHRWVLHPMHAIGRSLETDKTEEMVELGKEPHELGRIARLVIASSEQRAELHREIGERAQAQEALARSERTLRENIEERARLGRDLHDGVIQSLYAAGMGLAGIRMQLRPDQIEAATQLEQTRATLNETIHDVRNFIVGLEPESLKLQSFSHAVTHLVDTMRAMRPFAGTVKIDDQLASQLTLAQRVHALQIAREAVSNALRHGEAAHVHVTLRADGEIAEFEVTDDGRGFDTSSPSVQGRGLQNFAQRARELGGELAVESQLGQGTRVRLLFSL